MRVLVAESEPRLAARLLRVLADAGCTVTAIGEGAGALAAARGGDFDVLVLDDALPGLSGPGILRTLREEGDATPTLLVGAQPAEPCPLGELPHRLGSLLDGSDGTGVVTLLPEDRPRMQGRTPWRAAHVLELLRRAG